MKSLTKAFLCSIFVFQCFISIAHNPDLISNNSEKISVSKQINIENRTEENQNMACSVEFTGIGNIQCDGEVIDYSIYFDSNEFGANGYFLIRNGITTGPHFTMDSVHWGDISYCQEEEMLIIYDADEPTCRDTFIWESPCCPCEFSMEVGQNECEYGVFNVIFGLYVSEGSCLSYWDSGVFTINGVPYPFTYIGGNSFEVSGLSSNAEYLTYRFTFEEPLGEYFEVTRFNYCRYECSIENFEMNLDSNSCSGEFVSIDFDFGHYIFGGSGYKITSNHGHEFNFVLGSNRTFDIIADCENDYTFYLSDNESPECIDSFHFGQICCPCFGTYSELEKSPCQNNSFNAVQVFDYQTGSCFGGDWNLTHNGISKEFNWVNNNYLEINDINLPDSLITYELCWEGGPSTCFSLTSTNPCFISDFQCQITFEELSTPVCVDDSIQISLLLYGQNISFQGYDVYVNDSFYTWLQYEDDSTYNLMIPDPNTNEYVLRICNNYNQECCFTRTLENPCYDHSQDCFLVFDFEGSGPNCINNEIVANWHIFSENSSETGYDVYVNNMLVYTLPHQETGFYPMAFTNPGTDTFVMRICDHTYQNCCREWVLDNPCAGFNPECSLVLDTLSAPACVNGMINFNLQIFGDSISETNFIVYRDYSTVATLSYRPDSVYQFSIQNVNQPSFNLAVCDQGNPGCCAIIEINNPCSPILPECSVQFDTIGLVTCSNGDVNMTLSIGGDSLSMAGFLAYVNDTLVATLPQEQGGIYSLSFGDPGYQNFVLTLCDAGNSGCCTEKSFANPCYNPGADCQLTFEKVGDAICDSAFVEFTIFIDGENHSQSGYQVYLDSSIQVVLPYADDSLYTIRVPDSGRPFFNIMICDETFDQCCYTREYANPCYDPNIDCSLTFEALAGPVCNNNNVTMTLSIVGENVSESAFDVYLDGSLLISLPYNSSNTYPFTMAAPAGSGFVLTICDNDHTECCLARTFENPCYTGPDTCDIVFVETTDLICENGQVVASIQVLSQHTSTSGYDVLINDSLTLFLPFSADSTYQFTFPDPGSGEFIMTICDHENAACCRGRLMTNPCAPQGRCLIDNLESQASQSGQDSVLLEINYRTSGVCLPTQTATLWIELNAPVEYETDNQSIIHTFEKIEKDTLVGKLCFVESPDTCITMLIVNPFTTKTIESAIQNIRAFSHGRNIVIYNPDKTPYQWILTDVFGHAILKGSSVETQQNHRATDLPSGIYLLAIFENQKVYTYKLFIAPE